MNLLEKIYLFFYHRKKKMFLSSQKKLPLPVVSIGNLTLGGTGKTPFTIELAKEALSRGFHPIILTRGYKGKLKGPLMVTPEDKPEDVGDEPLMMALEGLKVFKGINRYEAGLFAIEKLGISDKDKIFFILDDGFQHWRLHRNLNILLIDGIKGFGNYHLLPIGSLRSPLEEVNSADMVFITKRENTKIKEEVIKLGAKVIYYAPIRILGLKNENGELINAHGKTAFAFAGIGNFESFLESLTEFNIKVIDYKNFIDHKSYSEKIIKNLLKKAKNSEILITTKKDFIKLRDYIDIFNGKITYLDISLLIGKEAIKDIFQRIERAYN